MEDSITPTQNVSDDVFLENGHPIQVAGGPPGYRRSSSVTTSQTPFLKRESVRRISEPSFFLPPEETKHCTWIAVIAVLIVVLAAIAGGFFYRLELKNGDLQRQLSELKAEFEASGAKLRASTNTEDAPRDDENCVCSSGKAKQGDKIEDFKTYDENGSSSILQCCAHDREQVISLIKEAIGAIEPKDDTDHSSGHRSFAYAHVSGTNGTVKANNPMFGHMTGWHVQSANRTLFSRGCIKIEYAGMYFVYSQIYFYTEQNRPTSEPTNITAASNHEPMLHETCRNEKPIMKSAVPYRDFTSKYHGGVFKLEKNDEISIRVSKNDYHVNLNPELTFFGVYSLEE
ncbi:uncharacterized protein LOC117101350 [Anneissia japonica]|uniref:uncharacterized protein LOC117101350 n=1 Tax=Anneissia japonica TaxID=1529436 RepID=UPI00142551EB|nr:uncharacterized protein LOC117101350 [Anneissia japonica]